MGAITLDAMQNMTSIKPNSPVVSFMQTISRALTHKRRIENVYVTSTTQVSENEFLCGAFIPQANAYLNDMRSSRNDVTLTVIEIGRQIGIALCHAHMGVGHGNVFVLNTMQFETFADYHATDWMVEDTLLAQVHVDRHVYRSEGSLGAVRAVGDLYVGERKVCRMESNWVIQPVASGRRLREISRTRNLRLAQGYRGDMPSIEGFRVDPIFPARRAVLDKAIWIGNNGNRFAATLKVDLDNMFFFDHENDHVPGMLILEGMRELAVDVAMRYPRAGGGLPNVSRVDIGFDNFAELDHPVELIAEVEDKADTSGRKAVYIRIEARQFGKPVSEGRFIVD